MELPIGLQNGNPADGASPAKKKIGKVLLLYSGGLDTSVMCKWIPQQYGCKLVTLTLDVGQKQDFKATGKKAVDLGAIKHVFADVKDEFVKDYCFPALKANALYQGSYPVSSSIARYLLASKAVEVAKQEGCDAIAHGCTGKGNDQVRFDLTIKSLAPEIEVIAPVREWAMGRDAEIKYAQENNIPIKATQEKPYSVDENLWGRSIEAGVLEDPFNEPPADIYEWTSDPAQASDKPAYATIEFQAGIPASLKISETENGGGVAVTGPKEIVDTLNMVAGAHGVGRIDCMEDRIVGLKSHEIYECPAAVTLVKAHKDLEKFVCTRHENLLKEQLDGQWAYFAYAGLWMDPLMADLNAFNDSVNCKVTGTVKVKLWKGSASIVGRKSQNAIYSYSLATYNVDSTFNQMSAPGFIELWGLQSVMAAQAAQKARVGKKSSAAAVTVIATGE